VQRRQKRGVANNNTWSGGTHNPPPNRELTMCCPTPTPLTKYRAVAKVVGEKNAATVVTLSFIALW